MEHHMQMRKIDRLDEFANYKNLNDNEITTTCGLGVGTIGKSRRQGKDLSKRIAQVILDHYPDLSREWFLTGQGEMLAPPKAPDFPEYPLIDLAKAECGRPAGLSEAIMAEGLPKLAIPGVPSDTEFFIQTSGYSMINDNHPELSIPPGALVGLSRAVGPTIRWGEVYALATADGIMIKRVLPDEKDRESVVCASYNSTDYPPFSIRKDEICDMARLTCVVPVFIR